MKLITSGNEVKMGIIPIMLYLREHPIKSVSDISAACEMPDNTARGRLKMLCEAGYAVKLVNYANKNVYYLTGKGEVIANSLAYIEALEEGRIDEIR